MINLNKYNEYILDMILEQVGGDMVFQIFPRLLKILRRVEHPISTKLINMSNYRKTNKKITYLDYENVKNKEGKDDVMFTFSQTNKVIDFLSKNDVEPQSMKYFINGYQDSSDLIGSIPRVPGKIGKVVKTLFGNEFAPSGKPGEDIESFTNAIKSKIIINFDEFKIVEGDDIVKYYNVDQYSSVSKGSTLGQSCMRYSKCENYIQFYNLNKKHVKLVILFDKNEEDKIVGRALLWNLTEIDDKPTDRLFMDRIYSITDVESNMFKLFAKMNGWLHKYKQNMNESEYIVDTKIDEKENLKLSISGIVNNDEYPYMDTMKYYDSNNGVLTNDQDNIDGDFITLESTSGGYEDDEDEDHYELDYNNFYDEYLDEDYLTWCDLGASYRKDDDAIWMESEQEYATEKWVDDNAVFSKSLNEYIRTENAVFSKQHDSWLLKEDSVIVIIDYNDKTQVDYRKYKDDDSHFIYTYTNDNDEVVIEHYDKKLINHFVIATMKIDEVTPFVWDDKYKDENHSRYYDKIKDKNKFFESNGHYFIISLKNEVIK